MLWNITSPFFRSQGIAGSRWLDDAVAGGRHRFSKVPFAASAMMDWHRRSGRATPVRQWRDYWTTGGRALQGAGGVITVFPQLAVTTALHRMLSPGRPPIVAWCFNLGRLPGGARRAAARLALGGVERFVVHSSAEIDLVSEYLGIDRGRVRFVPLQRSAIPLTEAEDEEAPFAVAMGSANRDYPTLIEAARMNGLPLTIVASPRSTQDLRLPPNVTIRSGISPEECHRLAQRARFSIVPLADVGAASGQVTVIEAQRMGRPVIATRSIGTSDYIADDRTGVLVEPADPGQLASAMQALWHDRSRRERIAAGGAAFAAERLSDEAAARALVAILDEFL